MTNTAEKLLRGALKLDSKERAELAAQIIASLDGGPDDDVEGAWAAEIQHRAEQARSGEDPGRPWTEAKEQLRSKLRER